MIRRRRFAMLCAVLLAASPARAQFGSFGQNKIQYRDFDWHILKGEHLDVYYYPAEERIARLALAYGEESYDSLSRRFEHTVNSRIPLLIYASHADFEQTNVLPFVPPEGVLGVTEFLKGRVAVPFRGSYSEFRHTLRHELVHVFQLSIESRQFRMYPRGRGASTPLWWSEGLAEFFSSPQETRDEMIVRDLTLRGGLPSIAQLGRVYSPIVYPLGGELHRFLATRYGEWRIGLLYRTLWKYASFEAALQGVYGRSAEELSAEWSFALRQRFFPNVADRRPLEVAARMVAPLAVKPVAIEREGKPTEIAYLSPRTGYTNIYSRPLDGGRERVVVAGERSVEFESLHAFQSRLDSRNGVIVFGSKFGDRDALFFCDATRGKVLGRYQFDSLVAVLSPAWSPDGQRVAFSGLSIGGISDLYVLTLATGTLHHVTDDQYEDLDPTWISPSTLVFSSDRGAGGNDGARNLFRVSLPTGAVSALTAGTWLDETPRWDPEQGRVLFTSDRDGTFNLYSVDSLGAGRRESRLDDGVLDPAPVAGDSRVLIGGFGDLTWSVFLMPIDSAARKDTFVVAATDSGHAWPWRELADAAATKTPSLNYRRAFSLDFAAGATQIAPGGYGSQGAQFFFSDLLGDDLIAVSAAFYGNSSFNNLLADLNADVLYLNQARRLNWGVGAFRLSGSFIGRDRFEVYQEKSTGAYGLVRYPLSRYTRIEAQTRLEYSNRDDNFSTLVEGPAKRRGMLASNFVSMTSDNTVWLDTGPIDGMRWNVTGGVVSDMTHGVFENWLGLVDTRKYFRASLQSAFAIRTMAYASEGARPRAVQIGGSWLLRGYPGFTQDGTRAWVFNSEYRFPITNYVTLGFPFGPIRFPSVQGAFFADAGQAWFKRDYDPRVKGSAGIGFRMALFPGLVLRLDVGKRYSHFGRASDEVGNFYRARFADFFIGYNY